MEAMAPDEMDQDHRQKSGREELDQIRELREEIRAKEQEIRELREEIRAKEEEIRVKEEEIRELREEIRAKEQEIREVEKELASASGTEVRKLLEAKLQFLWQEISSIRQDILSRHQQISSIQQEICSILQDILCSNQQISSFRQEIRSVRPVQEAAASAEPPMTVETMKKLLEDAMTKLVRDLSAKSAILSLSMSSITTKVADNVLKMAGFSVVDGSEVEPAGEVSVSKEWEFDMGQYAKEEDYYEPFFKHMVKYLSTVHAVKIEIDGPIPCGYCRLLDVHKSNNELELEAELGDRTLKITGNLDAVFVPRRRGIMQYKNSLLGGVEVKHLTAHKEIFKHGAPTVGIAKSGRSAVPGQALMEALAVYAYSDLPEGIFLLTSYDENLVLKLKDREIWCWAGLNFAQAMDKIAAFLNGDDVQKFLTESEKPARSREEPHISDIKRSVRKKLKIEGLGNEKFLSQMDAIRSTAGDHVEIISDLFQVVESRRYSTTEACGSAGPLSYFS